MKRLPMTITVHTNMIKASDYGDLSFLGEPMNEPLQRCMICNIQPEFFYENQKQTYHIHHVCRIMNANIDMKASSYEELCNKWNKERGKRYGKNESRDHRGVSRSEEGKSEAEQSA